MRPFLSPPLLFLIAATAAAPLTAQTQSSSAPPHHRPARTGVRRPIPPVSHCPIPAPALSPKIPSLPAGLGCPKILYALTYVDLKVGTGELAQPHQFYTVHYTGYLTDGTKFDSSYDHPGGEPITFPYGAHRVIPGWDTGFEGMHVGGKRRLFIPYQLAYGEAGRPPVIPPKAELIFDVELVSQSDTPPAPPPGSQVIPPQGRPTSPPPGTPPPAGASQPQSDSSGAGTPPPTTPPPSHPQL
jgi:peptidylprolyl isomerase